MSEQMEMRSLGLWEIRAWTGPWGGKGQENLLLLPSTSWADFPLAKKKTENPLVVQLCVLCGISGAPGPGCRFF